MAWKLKGRKVNRVDHFWLSLNFVKENIPTIANHRQTSDHHGSESGQLLRHSTFWKAAHHKTKKGTRKRSVNNAAHLFSCDPKANPLYATRGPSGSWGHASSSSQRHQKYQTATGDGPRGSVMPSRASVWQRRAVVVASVAPPLGILIRRLSRSLFFGGDAATGLSRDAQATAAHRYPSP